MTSQDWLFAKRANSRILGTISQKPASREVNEFPQL
jgi:hypothetical protein